MSRRPTDMLRLLRFTPSFSYIGQGIIMGSETVLSMNAVSRRFRLRELPKEVSLTQGTTFRACSAAGLSCPRCRSTLAGPPARFPPPPTAPEAGSSGPPSPS